MRPNWLDWLVYRIFRWWWNPIFLKNPKMVAGLSYYLKFYLEENNQRGCFSLEEWEMIKDILDGKELPKI